MFGKEFASITGSLTEKAKDKPNDVVGLAKPMLSGLSPPTTVSPRGVGDFMRTLEDLRKENRPPTLDVFE